MSRFARTRRVFFFEEPVFEDVTHPHLRAELCKKTGVHVQTPVLPFGLSHAQIVLHQRLLLRDMVVQHGIGDHIAWYYTPMAC